MARMERERGEKYIHIPPITTGTKYQVLCLKIRTRCHAVDSPNKTAKRIAAAKDGS